MNKLLIENNTKGISINDNYDDDNFKLIDINTILNNNEIIFSLIYDQKWSELEKFIKQTNISIDVNMQDKNNNYIIQLLVLYNKHELLKYFYEKNIRIDVYDIDGKSLLYIPIRFNYYHLIESLLDYNKKVVGITITDLKDVYNKYPIFYAIDFKKNDIAKLILANMENYNINDKNNNSILQYSIKSDNIDIIKNIITKYTTNINNINLFGQTALHIAVIKKQYDVVYELLYKGINSNIQDYNNEYSAIFYSVITNDFEMTKLILDNRDDIDVNIQDKNGNTIIYYAINNDNFKIYKYIIDNAKNINYKIHTIKFVTYGTAILINNNINSEKISEYLNLIIKYIPLNVVDTYGNTTFLLMCKNKIWKKYIDKLKISKIDIYRENNHGNTPLDYIDGADLDMFYDMIANSYLYNLKKYKKDYIGVEKQTSIPNGVLSETNVKTDDVRNEEWYNLCSKNNQSNDNKCLKLIKDYIIKTKRSIPYMKRYKVKIEKLNDIKYGSFTGYIIDILFGLIYLLDKFKPSIISSLNDDFINNKNLIQFYNSLGIYNSIRNEYNNFEIIWINNNLFLPTNFENSMVYFHTINANKINHRFFIIPIGIEMENNSGHGNYLFYDIKTNIAERFEPHGSRTSIAASYNGDLLDELLTKELKKYNKNLIYLKPVDFLPKIGFQILDLYESSKSKKIGDPLGFCALWSIWYIELKVKHADIPSKILVKNALEEFTNKQISLRDTIRNYSINITNIRDEILSMSNIDINTWINNNYNNNTWNNINDDIRKKIIKIKKEIYLNS